MSCDCTTLLYKKVVIIIIIIIIIQIIIIIMLWNAPACAPLRSRNGHQGGALVCPVVHHLTVVLVRTVEAVALAVTPEVLGDTAI